MATKSRIVIQIMTVSRFAACERYAQVETCQDVMTTVRVCPIRPKRTMTETASAISAIRRPMDHRRRRLRRRLR